MRQGRRLGRDCLADAAVEDELHLVRPRHRVVLHGDSIQHRAHRLRHHRLADIELAQRAPLGHHHQRRDLERDRQRRDHVRQCRETACLHQQDPAQPAHPRAGHDAQRLLLPRRRKRREERVGMHRIDQRAQHVVRHVGHQPDLVALQHLHHDFVPGARLFH